MPFAYPTSLLLLLKWALLVPPKRFYNLAVYSLSYILIDGEFMTSPLEDYFLITKFLFGSEDFECGIKPFTLVVALVALFAAFALPLDPVKFVVTHAGCPLLVALVIPMEIF